MSANRLAALFPSQATITALGPCYRHPTSHLGGHCHYGRRQRLGEWLHCGAGIGSSVTLQGNIYTEGGNLSVYGDTITVSTQSGNVILSTRRLEDSPGNPASDPSEGNSGDHQLQRHQHHTGQLQQLDGKRRSLQPGSIRSSAHLLCGRTINITALQEAGAGTGTGFNFPVLPEVDTSSTSITLNNAIVVGGSVSFTANAENLHATTSAPNETNSLDHSNRHQLLQNLQYLLGGVEVSNASTTIDLKLLGSSIMASKAAMAEGLTDAGICAFAIPPSRVSTLPWWSSITMPPSPPPAASPRRATSPWTRWRKTTMLIKALDNSNTGNGSGGAHCRCSCRGKLHLVRHWRAARRTAHSGGQSHRPGQYAELQSGKSSPPPRKTATSVSASPSATPTTRPPPSSNGQATVQGNALVQATEAKYGVNSSSVHHHSHSAYGGRRQCRRRHQTIRAT